ncbi:hypothetical protein FJZ22_00500 [Candidatus Pacearchaeota archaeon]|nr:hypothetical protein [Candidatus Pacearchaeota archaeon]
MDDTQLRALVHQLEQNHVHLQAVSQQLEELEQFTHAFPHAQPSSSVLVPVGKGVFMEGQLAPQQPACFVEVGAGFLVKKTRGEVVKTLGEQTAHLRTAKTRLLHQQAELESQAQKLLEQNL